MRTQCRCIIMVRSEHCHLNPCSHCFQFRGLKFYPRRISDYMMYIKEKQVLFYCYTQQELANFFCDGPDNKYFRYCKLHHLVSVAFFPPTTMQKCKNHFQCQPYKTTLLAKLGCSLGDPHIEDKQFSSTNSPPNYQELEVQRTISINDLI